MAMDEGEEEKVSVRQGRLCLKFKTNQAQDVKKMEKLNNIFFALMVRGPEESWMSPARHAVFGAETAIPNNISGPKTYPQTQL
ncbi:Signal recognition particle 9 kDa protein [Platanthera guangdongensis]|uniref:Signal recognition particle 9 kDa protein n=1 Tax=Platanthera guangdongensis TaxID=2320717 RepID=A0ABR2LE16_9ASPA